MYVQSTFAPSADNINKYKAYEELRTKSTLSIYFDSIEAPKTTNLSSQPRKSQNK